MPARTFCLIVAPPPGYAQFMKLKACVLIPCYRERERIADVVKGCLRHVPTVLVVDDGSGDGTAEAARKAGAEVIVHGTNQGKGVALNTGFDWTLEHGFDAALCLDGDGQHDPDEIPKFLEAAEAPDVHIVLGSRMHDVADMPGIRQWSNRTTSKWVSRLGHNVILDSQSGYRLIKSEVLKAVHIRTGRYDAEPELLIKAGRAGFKVLEIPIATIYPADGKSSINPTLDTIRFVKLVIRCLLTR